MVKLPPIAGSSNGRTRESGSRYLGSNPSPAAIFGVQLLPKANGRVVPAPEPSKRIIDKVTSKNLQLNQVDNQTTPSKSLIPQLEDLGDQYLVQKAPFQLPPGVKEFIVQFGPYITLVLMLLALPIILIALGISAFLLPFGYTAGGAGLVSTLGLVIAVASLILEAMALPGLFKRSKTGWNFVFYSILLSAVGSLIHLDIVGLIIGTLISLYILFQIRSYYK